MPVPFELVPLDTAKSWAKRLQRSSRTISPQSPWPLSKCQLAVAQMLGFEHWHALNKAAQQPAERSQIHREDAFGSHGNARLVEDAPSSRGHDYIYPDKQVMGSYTLEKYGLIYGLIEDVQNAIRRVATLTTPGKVMMLSGYSGVGKTHLMQALVNDITCSRPSLRGAILGDPPEIINHVLSHVPVIHTAGTGDRQKQMRESWSQGLHAILRGDPDLIVIEETHQHSVHATAAAAKSGSIVFTTMQSAPGRMINDLQALDSTQKWEQMISGWVDIILLPLLCSECSLHCSNPGRERKRGGGCGHCRYRGLSGLSGHVPVFDVWEIRDGKLAHISCMKNQARRLIAGGVVDRETAEGIIGRLDG